MHESEETIDRLRCGAGPDVQVAGAEGENGWRVDKRRIVVVVSHARSAQDRRPSASLLVPTDRSLLSTLIVL